jgi:cyclophilin family peptidyl-prolyl cis-trans isomerase
MSRTSTRPDNESSRRSSRRGGRQLPRRARPALEALEQREVPSLSTLGAFDPGTGTWYLRNEVSAGVPDVGVFSYGAPNWSPVIGDWTGRGLTSVGVVDPSTATWYLRNENSPGAPDAGSFKFGAPGWIPVVGDWNGSGHTGIGTFDPRTATWYLRNEVSAGPADAGTFRYGLGSWVPVTGDWTGHGRTSIGMFDPRTATWYLRNENSGGSPDAGQFTYGLANWKPVVGDWNNDGQTTVGVIDPRGTWYLRNSNSAGRPDVGQISYGLGAWKPVSGTWGAGDAPFVKAPIAAQTLTAQGSGNTTTLDLAGTFDDNNITDTLVRIDTSSGPVNVELFDRAAPRTVANFLNYVTSNRYDSSVFHRSAKQSDGTHFVLQGGGFTFKTNPSRLDPIQADPAVMNEPDPVKRSNLRGTLAMAKLGNDPNSATDQFFFNLGDNSANLDNQNGGFTVFGKVVGPADQAVVDALANIPTQDESQATALPATEKGVFNEIPLQGPLGVDFPTSTTRNNYAIVNTVAITRRTVALTYSMVSNSDTSVATTSLANNRLTVQAVKTGTTTITVRATNQGGGFVDATFTVTVS